MCSPFSSTWSETEYEFIVSNGVIIYICKLLHQFHEPCISKSLLYSTAYSVYYFKNCIKVYTCCKLSNHIWSPNSMHILFHFISLPITLKNCQPKSKTH